MRIAVTQFSPKLGEIEANIAQTDTLLANADIKNVDLLVLPELAFSGYAFSSFELIKPHLEPTAAGRSTTWARETASRLRCNVTVGYPEISTDLCQPTQVNSSTYAAYNAQVTVSPEGKVLSHYRKKHLYYVDEAWAREGSSSEWLSADLIFPRRKKTGNDNSNYEARIPESSHRSMEQGPLPRENKLSIGQSAETLRASFGICMDLNPYRFVAPRLAYEFATAAVANLSSLIILTMAWTTWSPSDLPPATDAVSPHLETLNYWVNRLLPVVRADKTSIIVVANRTGEDPGLPPNLNWNMPACDRVCYVGTSSIMRLGHGKIEIIGVLAARESGVLICDTTDEALYSGSILQTSDDD
ncbi:Carbon-nitrogen hydrolase [Agyrium rufum]|nr:Carbon-nitrogen hydrolase [Agyrium rufum]